MFNSNKIFSKKNILRLGLAASLTCSFFYLENTNKNIEALASSSLEYRWGKDDNYKRLKFLQGSKERLDRSKYYFFLRKNERKTAILKLSLKFPDHFKATIKSKKLSLCKVKIGGYTSRTRCIEEIPAIIEIDKAMKNIEIFPKNPIPSDKNDYAVVLKMFNPRKSGMYQINAFSQSPGELPISLYIGSYIIYIE